MLLTLETTEIILRSHPKLKVIFDQKYELSFESEIGLQIAVNRRSSARAIGIWIENTFDPSRIGLSLGSHITHYPPNKSRAHLSAKRLRGPYINWDGNDCWYIAVTVEKDLNTILIASFC